MVRAVFNLRSLAFHRTRRDRGMKVGTNSGRGDHRQLAERIVGPVATWTVPQQDTEGSRDVKGESREQIQFLANCDHLLGLFKWSVSCGAHGAIRTRDLQIRR